MKSGVNFALAAFLAAAISSILPSGALADAGDLARIRQNITNVSLLSVDLVMDVEPPVDDEREVCRWIETQSEDGSWGDVDYADRSRSAWKPFDHLHRAKIIAVRSCRTSDAKARKVAVRALDFWLSKARPNPNWWWKRIGEPQNVGLLAILLRDSLSRETMARAVMNLAVVDRPVYTAMNRVWEARVMLYRGLLADDERLVKTARDFIAAEIRRSDGEGIMSDWSFHQHGNMLATAGYGLFYLYAMGRAITVFSGTAYAIPPEKVRLIEDYLENAFTPSFVGDRIDYALVPRGFFPKDAWVFGRRVLDSVALIGASGSSNGRRVADVFARRDFPEGFRWFWQSAYCTYRGKGWLMSHRGGTRGIVGAETWINGDNPLGQHLADGTLMTYVTGREYEDISPLWNWRRLPGITSYADIGPDMRFSCRPGTANGLEDYRAVTTGGVSTVLFGVSREGLSYRQRIAFSARGAVAETYDICSTNPALRVATCVESAIACPNAGIVSQTETETLVRNGDIVYVISAPRRSVEVSIADRTGDYQSVKSSLPSIERKARVLEICINHGKAPRGARALYRIIPVGAACPKARGRQAHDNKGMGRQAKGG